MNEITSTQYSLTTRRRVLQQKLDKLLLNNSKSKQIKELESKLIEIDKKLDIISDYVIKKIQEE